MISQDQQFRGGSYGRDLLIDALKRIVQVSNTLGVTVIILDMFDS